MNQLRILMLHYDTETTTHACHRFFSIRHKKNHKRFKEQIPMRKMAKRERVKGTTVQPVALMQLLAKLGLKKTADALGVARTTVNNARLAGAVTLAYEQAAKLKLQELAKGEEEPAPAKQTPGGRTLVIFEVPDGRVEAVEKIITKLGGEKVS